MLIEHWEPILLIGIAIGFCLPVLIIIVDDYLRYNIITRIGFHILAVAVVVMLIIMAIAYIADGKAS